MIQTIRALVLDADARSEVQPMVSADTRLASVAQASAAKGDIARVVRAWCE